MADPLGDSVPLTDDPRIDVVTQGSSWGFGAGPHVLTYSFNTVPGGAAWSTAAQSAVTQALSAWAAVANVSFSQITSGDGINESTADLAFGLSNGELLNQAGAVGIAGFPDAANDDVYRDIVNAIFGTSYTSATYAKPEGDVFIESDYPGFAYLQPGGDGLLTILHEIGHALGLKHPFDDGGNGRPTAIELGVPQYDDGLQTIMSDDFVSPFFDIGNQATPMPLDILAIQQIYGANMTYHTGDDSYFLSLGGIVQTIWDAGGIDTIRAGGLDVGVNIDLHEGSFIRYGDNTGLGSITAIAFGTIIENAVGTSQSDEITGNSVANYLTGDSGNDILRGEESDDTLDGGAGADVLVGGLGDDTFIVDDKNDIAVDEVNGGFDTVLCSSSIVFLGSGIDKLVINNAFGVHAQGNDLANLIIGNTGSDHIWGLDGNDTLEGGGGLDLLEGGSGDDTYIVDDPGDQTTEAKNAGTDTCISAITWTLGAQIENLSLSGSGNLNATGNELGNSLLGNAGKNALDGKAGDDTMAGGADDDTYYVDNVADVVIELPDEGKDKILSTVSYTLAANVETLVLQGTAAVKGVGNAGANELIGNSLSNVLDGKAGADTMRGGAGNDVYYVDDSNDVIDEAGGSGFDTVIALTGYALPDSVETLHLTFAGSVAGIGNALPNLIDAFGGGDNLLDGKGGADTMVGGAGNDFYRVDVAGDVVRELVAGSLGGHDTVESAVSYILGTNLEDLVLIDAAKTGTGNAADNSLTGDDLANLLDGKAGADTMIGGKGDDVYILDNPGDQVIEFSGEGIDEIRTSLQSADLYGAVENWTFTGAAAVSFSGNPLANRLTGTAKNDTLSGAGGDDTLDGKAGADSLTGGTGNDTYVVDNAKDVVDESGGDGTDKVQSTISYALVAGLENLELLGSGAINGTGNDDANDLVGNKAANKLDGMIGADTMQGNGGSDTYTVNEAGDQVIETIAGAAGGIDLVLSAVSFDLSLADREQVEKLTLTGGVGDNIDATGNGLANTLTGNAGNNKLDGQGGADRMAGGLGNDTYVVDLKTDLVTEAAKAGTDTVQSFISYVLGANLENLELQGLLDIDGTGNAADNKLTGNGGNNRLDGKAGADTMSGRLGNDTYVIDNLGDIADETGGGGIDTIMTPFAAILGVEFEYLTLTGAAAVAGTGNDKANVILGNGGANVLTGLGENDSLAGGAGNDSLDGGTGKDRVDGGTGADNLAGGGGDDTYIVDNAKDVVTELSGGGLDTVESSVTHILAAEVENLTLKGAGAINGTGNALANVIVGNAAANILSGGVGDDTLDGGKGADKLTGGDGSDHFLHHGLADGKDTITDFHTGPGGDVLDIHDMLVGYVDGVSNAADFVQCVVGVAGTTVKVDADGLDNGAKFTDVFVLTGVTTDLGTLLADDNIQLA